MSLTVWYFPDTAPSRTPEGAGYVLYTEHVAAMAEMFRLPQSVNQHAIRERVEIGYLEGRESAAREIINAVNSLNTSNGDPVPHIATARLIEIANTIIQGGDKP